jgi:hypothetical protein
MVVSSADTRRFPKRVSPGFNLQRPAGDAPRQHLAHHRVLVVRSRTAAVPAAAALPAAPAPAAPAPALALALALAPALALAAAVINSVGVVQEPCTRRRRRYRLLWRGTSSYSYRPPRHQHAF